MFMEQMNGDWVTDKDPCTTVFSDKTTISDNEIEVEWTYQEPEFEPAYTNPLTGISVYVG